jgi:3-oxoacyl-[acyl-carrier protein] reductase
MSRVRSVAVIGGTGGIGSEIAREFAAHGWRVLLTYHSSRLEAERVCKSIREKNGEATAVRLGPSSSTSSKSFLAAVRRFSPTLQAVVFSQGVIAGKSLASQSIEDIRRTIDVNLFRVLVLAKRLVPFLSADSSITFVSSISAFAGSYDPVYAATKGALVSLSKSLARYLGPEIRSNTVAPGVIEGTRMARAMSPSVKRGHQEKTALRRLGVPGDVARAVYFLSSESGRHITGATLDVNGGEYFR